MLKVNVNEIQKVIQKAMRCDTYMVDLPEGNDDVIAFLVPFEKRKKRYFVTVRDEENGFVEIGVLGVIIGRDEWISTFLIDDMLQKINNINKSVGYLRTYLNENCDVSVQGNQLCNIEEKSGKQKKAFLCTNLQKTLYEWLSRVAGTILELEKSF